MRIENEKRIRGGEKQRETKGKGSARKGINKNHMSGVKRRGKGKGNKRRLGEGEKVRRE